MADISAIKALDGVTYSIKDSEARDHLVPASGTTGQVLTKTASGYGWADASGGGTVDTVNGISPDSNKNVQVDVELTQDEYDALPASKLTDDVNYWIKDGKNNPLNNTVMASGVAYDNTDSGLTATNVQGAVDELNNGLMNVEILSYDERKIGTWVNGKPLYRKGVLINSLPNATGSDYPHGISNVDTIYTDFGNSVLIFPSGNCTSFNYIGGNNNATVEVQYVSKTVIHIDAHSTDRRSAKAIIFLKYTKTTD